MFERKKRHPAENVWPLAILKSGRLLKKICSKNLINGGMKFDRKKKIQTLRDISSIKGTLPYQTSELKQLVRNTGEIGE